MPYQPPSMGMKAEAMELLGAAAARDDSDANADALSFLNDDAPSAQKTNSEAPSTSQAGSDTATARDASAQSTRDTVKASEPATAEDDAEQDNADDATIAALPLNQQEAGRKLIEKRKAATQEAKDLRAELARYKAGSGEGGNAPAKANEGVKSPSDALQGGANGTPVDLSAALAAIPDPIPYEERLTADFLAEGDAKLDEIRQSFADMRVQYVAELNQDVGAGLIQQPDMDAALAQADNSRKAEIRGYELELQNARYRLGDQERQEAERTGAIQKAIAPLLDKYPYAIAEDVARWIGDGNDPEQCAKASHERNLPIVEKVRAAVAAPAPDTATAERIAALEKQVADAQAELDRRKARDRNAASAIPTIGSRGMGQGNAAPMGTTPARPSGGFGFMGDARKALGLRD